MPRSESLILPRQIQDPPAATAEPCCDPRTPHGETCYHATVIANPPTGKPSESEMSMKLKSVEVSTDVFAAIWGKRKDGENTEDAMLRRLLGCDHMEERSGLSGESKEGVHDSLNDVHFPENFEIFRIHENSKYTATARGGFWVREDTGQQFPTLNRLNTSITSKRENVWGGNWRYHTSKGEIRPIDNLRNKRAGRRRT